MVVGTQEFGWQQDVGEDVFGWEKRRCCQVVAWASFGAAPLELSERSCHVDWSSFNPWVALTFGALYGGDVMQQ